MNISLTVSKYMILVLLLISEGSWLFLLTAEKATLELAARKEMPSGEDELFQSAGFESQTTRHLPSRTMGSVSFWEKANSKMTARQNKRAMQSTNALFKDFMDTMMNDLHNVAKIQTALPIPSLRFCSVFVLVYAKHPSGHQ